MRRDPRAGPAVPRRIMRFQQDAAGAWTAVLECGHLQHVRHEPPWQNRPWTASAEGRAGWIGRVLECVRCAAAAEGG